MVIQAVAEAREDGAAKHWAVVVQRLMGSSRAPIGGGLAALMKTTAMANWVHGYMASLALY